MPGPEHSSELDAELAFIQKKISEGVSKARKELEETFRQQLNEAVQKASKDRDAVWEKRAEEAMAKAERELDAVIQKSERELEAAVNKARAEGAQQAERKAQDAFARKEAELAQGFRDELEKRNDALKAQLLQSYEKRENELKAQLAIDKKAAEEEIRRASDRELTRDRRDLEETFQAKAARKEQELKEQLDVAFKAREAELRRSLEVELRQKETELNSRFQGELNKRRTEVEAELEKKNAQTLTTDRARLEAELSRKTEATEARLSQESKAELQLEEVRLRERFTTELQNERKKIEADLHTRMFRRGRYAQLARRIKAPLFPFPAVVGQDKAKRALLLNAIDPSLGGVVLWGPEGNAKFGMVLGFAQVLAPVQEKLKLGLEDKRAWNDEERYLTGRIHYGKETGAYLVDTVLQNAALSLPRPPVKQGSPAHAGTVMPPAVLGSLRDEDEEAYHLLSTMTLQVEVASPTTVEERLEVIRRNFEFRKNAETFRQQYNAESEELRNNLLKARERLHGVTLPTKVMTLVARMTLLDRQSANLDVLMEQLARTNAAFDGRTTVESSDVMEAADLALLHRLTPREVAELERGLSSAPTDAQAAAARSKGT